MGPIFSMSSSPEFIFIQETLNRLIPPDGNGYWYSGYLAVSGGRKDRYLEVFEYIVDREEVDKEDERENNRVCIFRVACLGVEEESDSLCLSLKENFQWGKQMSTSYLMIPDSCDQRGGGISMFVCVCLYCMSLCFACPFMFCFCSDNGTWLIFFPKTTLATTNVLSNFSCLIGGQS